MAEPSPTPEDLAQQLNRAATATVGDDRTPWERHYAELRSIARRWLAREREDASLQPTALVHEAFVRMVDRSRVTEEGSRFFRTCFANECRRILVEHARKRARRDAKLPRRDLADSLPELRTQHPISLVELDEAMRAMERLSEQYARAARVVELRLFGGLSIQDCAHALQVSPRTVDNDWAFALAWLRRRLEGSTGKP